jgi:DNA-directed RNA polymerase II subunit RPB1
MLDLLKDDYDTLKINHHFDKDEVWSQFLSNQTIKDMKKVKGYQNVFDTYFEQIISDYKFIKEYVFKDYNSTNVNMPINLFRLINNTKINFKIIGTNLSNLNPLYVIDKLDELIDEMRVTKIVSSNKLFSILLRSYLSPKMVIKVHHINKIGFDYIISEIRSQYNNCKIEFSEMVGPIAAQSIGEPATQMTLNTFHFAGVASKSNVTRGVPRLKELLHLSKSLKSPSLTVYLNKNVSNDKKKCMELLNRFELTKLEDILKSVNVYYDPDDYNTIIEEDKELLSVYKVFNSIDNVLQEQNCGSKWIIRFELDKEKMVDKNITMELVYHKLNIMYSNTVTCVYSDDNASKLIFRLRLTKQSKYDNDKLNDLNSIKMFIKNLKEKLIIKGINNIKNVSMFKNMYLTHKGYSYEKKEEWILDTDGINLIDILQENNVDKVRTISNDIYEIYELLGIEAARNILLKEIKEVINGSGSYVNYRHLSLLCDTMTNKGSLMSIDRFGINRNTTGPLAKCSFEETTDQLFKASIYGEVDKLEGVSSNIMMGQIASCGTGNTEILLDESKLTDIMYEEDDDIGDIDTWEDKNDYCDENIGIDYDISNLDADNNMNIPVIIPN